MSKSTSCAGKYRNGALVSDVARVTASKADCSQSPSCAFWQMRKCKRAMCSERFIVAATILADQHRAPSGQAVASLLRTNRLYLDGVHLKDQHIGRIHSRRKDHSQAPNVAMDLRPSATGHNASRNGCGDGL